MSDRDNKRPSSATRTVGAVLFPGFELLDVFGPLEMFGVLAAAGLLDGRRDPFAKIAGLV